MVFSRARTRFAVLPPCGLPVSRQSFRDIHVDSGRYDELLAEMQMFRGKVYLSDGALRPGDLINGRHRLSIDERSWHVLSLDSDGRVSACLRYLPHLNPCGLDDLWDFDHLIWPTPDIHSLPYSAGICSCRPGVSGAWRRP